MAIMVSSVTLKFRLVINYLQLQRLSARLWILQLTATEQSVDHYVAKNMDLENICRTQFFVQLLFRKTLNLYNYYYNYYY